MCTFMYHGTLFATPLTPLVFSHPSTPSPLFLSPLLLSREQFHSSSPWSTQGTLQHKCCKWFVNQDNYWHRRWGSLVERSGKTLTPSSTTPLLCTPIKVNANCHGNFWVWRSPSVVVSVQCGVAVCWSMLQLLLWSSWLWNWSSLSPQSPLYLGWSWSPCGCPATHLHDQQTAPEGRVWYQGEEEEEVNHYRY